MVEQARAVSAKLPIIARSHSDEESEHLLRHGATKVIMGEQLIGHTMVQDAREAGMITVPDAAATAAAIAAAPVEAG